MQEWITEDGTTCYLESRVFNMYMELNIKLYFTFVIPQKLYVV